MKLKEIDKDLYSVDDIMNDLFGSPGTQQRDEFRKDAYSYCVGQIIHEARKQEKVTQSELAKRVGTNKSYISKIENGIIEPGTSLFFRIINALGLSLNISKPII